MPYEIEAKLRLGDIAAMRSMLERRGASNEGECLERNWVLDNPENGLARSGMLLRVRSVGGPGCILTVKRPVEGGEFKTREEIETMIDSTDDLLAQLLAIGFELRWIYEKFRQTWLWRDCVLALDDCPEIGAFLEIEGAPGRIREVASELGLDAADHLSDNYLGLWQKHLRALGQEKRDMVFTELEKNSRLPTRL